MALPSHHSACLLQRSYQEGLHVAALPQHSLRQAAHGAQLAPARVRQPPQCGCLHGRRVPEAGQAEGITRMCACMHVLC